MIAKSSRYTFTFAAGSDGKTDFNMKVDTNRLRHDAADGASRVGDVIEGLKEKANAPVATPVTPPASTEGGGPPAAAGLAPPPGLKR